MVIKMKHIGLVMLFFLVSCASYNFLSEDIVGVYKQSENRNIHLKISKKSFLFIDTFNYEHLPPYDCCDTIAFGNWKMDDRGFLSLSSPEELSTFYLNMEVVENQGKSKDSLYFLIKNPIEKFYDEYDRKKRDISYQLAITSNKSKLDNDTALKRFTTNYIAIKKDKTLNIDNFELIIYVDCETSVKNLETREIYTLPYIVSSQESNVFEIDIPKLDYGYISYKRLDNDYVKILTKNKLFWNGKEYSR